MRNEKLTTRVIDLLNAGIASSLAIGDEGDSASWQYEEGVIISRNDAEHIVKLLQTLEP